MPCPPIKKRLISHTPAQRRRSGHWPPAQHTPQKRRAVSCLRQPPSLPLWGRCPEGADEAPRGRRPRQGFPRVRKLSPKVTDEGTPASAHDATAPPTNGSGELVKKPPASLNPPPMKSRPASADTPLRHKKGATHRSPPKVVVNNFLLIPHPAAFSFSTTAP